MFVRISSYMLICIVCRRKNSNSGGNFENPNSKRSIFRVIWSDAYVPQCLTYPWKSQSQWFWYIVFDFQGMFTNHTLEIGGFPGRFDWADSDHTLRATSFAILLFLEMEDSPFPRKKDRCSWHTRQFFLTLLGRWSRDPSFAGCWWPPMIRDKKGHGLNHLLWVVSIYFCCIKVALKMH